MKINTIFEKAVEQGASDVHILAGEPPILRINGRLIRLEDESVLTAKTATTAISEILTEKQQEKFEKERELDISHEIPSGERFRVNLHFEKENPGLVARVISSKIPNMEEIAMPEIAYQLSRLNQGLVIITGPTGCGKSTTMAAMIDLINTERSCNIVTIEDPIEFVFKPKKSIIRQRQYGSDFISFPEALKHVLRQDPNVIMVGEMRDLETIASAITLAETGHLVLATLHTPNAAQTIDRIIDIFPPHQQNQIRTQLSMSLVGVIAQQLIPTTDNKTRVPAREIMINTPAIGNLIRENKIAQIKTVIQTSMEDGMVTMAQAVEDLVEAGTVTEEVAERYTV